MIGTLIRYAQAVRSARPGPLAGPVALALVGLGLGILGRVAGAQREQLAAGMAELQDMDEELNRASTTIRERHSQIGFQEATIAKYRATIGQLQAERDAIVAAHAPEPGYPAAEDLNPLKTAPVGAGDEDPA